MEYELGWWFVCRARIHDCRLGRTEKSISLRALLATVGLRTGNEGPDSYRELIGPPEANKSSGFVQKLAAALDKEGLLITTAGMNLL